MDTCEGAVLCRLLQWAGIEADTASAIDGVLGAPLGAVAYVLLGIVVYVVGRGSIRRIAMRYETEVNRRIVRAKALGTPGASRRAATRRLQRVHAVAGAARSGWGILVTVVVALLVLGLFVDLRPVLAGAGLAGIVIGFGAQSMIADLLAGFSMLVEDQYGVGDWIDVGGKVGEVEHVGLRATSFRDLDGTVWHVPNSQVTMVGNLSQRWARATLEIPLPLDVDIAHARRVVTAVADGLAQDEQWADDIIAPPEIWGITQWDAEGLRLRLVMATRPLRNWDVNRQLRERLKIAFDREDIRMPVPMRELSGSPLRSPVRLHGVGTPEPDRPAPEPFDPSLTQRLDAETGRVEPTDDTASPGPARPA